MADVLAAAAERACDDNFRGRVTAALVHQARMVLGHAPESDQSEFSRGYAAAVARGPAAFTESAAWVIATDPAIAAATPGDNAVLAAVESAWPYLAQL